MDNLIINPVILVGGVGTRLWPLSRESFPKQFTKPLGEESLFQRSLLRLASISNLGNIYLVVSESSYFICLEQLRELDLNNVYIIVEPVGRNTAPAVAVAAVHIAKYENPNHLMLVLPSDHHVNDDAAFVETIDEASINTKNKLILFGVRPNAPHTGYGYIQVAKEANLPTKVTCFIEKPNLDRATILYKMKNCFWNSGMFLFSAKAALSAFSTFSPEILMFAKTVDSEAIQQGNTFYLSKEVFSKMPNVPLDIAIIEKAQNAYVFPLKSDWSDLGDWNALYEGETQDENGNVQVGNIVSLETSKSYLHSKDRLLTTIGVNDLIIVSMKDSVLVADKNKVQNVKQLVEHLKSTKYADMVSHDFLVRRPWGSYETIIKNDTFQVKHIVVKPGGILSLQLHYHRSEHWVVVKGKADVLCGDKKFQLYENQSTYIPKETKHRLENTEDTPLHLIEVQVGEYLCEDDIVRFEDIYGRMVDSELIL